MTDVYPVNKWFSENGLLNEEQYFDMYRRSVEDNEGFWAEQAGILDWSKPFTKVKDVSYAKKDLHIRWFEDGISSRGVSCPDPTSVRCWKPVDGVTRRYLPIGRSPIGSTKASITFR